MSKSAQVRYLQALSDQIAESPFELPVPESHLQLAEIRLHLFREDPSRAHSAFEIFSRLKPSDKGPTGTTTLTKPLGIYIE